MAAEIRISILTSADGGAVKDVEEGIDSLGKTAKDAGGGFSALREIGIGALRELGAAALNLVGGGLKALGGAVMDGIADAREAAKINAQTAQVIKSTGEAAGVSAQHVQDYAASLSAAAGKSLFGDSQIQESTNLLLTFTNIKGTVLDAATAISVDMAQALGGAPKDAAIQLGKALNDPIKGVTALTRVGVTFSQDQKDMIQAMVETGDVAGAQGVILAELSKEFGGSAAAAAAADGGWAQFNDRLGEAKEAIGTAILPLLNILVGVLNDSVMPVVERAAAAFSAWLSDPAVQASLQQLVGLIQQGLAFALTTVLPLIQGLFASFAAGGDPIQGFINVLSQVSPVFAVLYGVVQEVLPTIRVLVNQVFSDISTFVQQHGATMVADVMETWNSIRETIVSLVGPIAAVVQALLVQIMMFWRAHGEEILAFIASTWAQINEIIRLAMELIQATVVPLLQALAAFIQAHGTEIQAILTITWNTIQTIITTILAIIRGVITAALAAVRGDWTGAWEAIKAVGIAVWNAIKAFLAMDLQLITALFKSTWDGIKAYFQGIMDSIVGWVVQTFEAIKNAIVSSAGKLRSAAGGVADAIVDGIASGISNGASAIINAAKDAAMSALNAAKSALGISSPSKLFAEIGMSSAEGMAMGLVQGTPMVAAAGAGVAASAAGGARTYNQQRSMSYSPTINNYGAASDGLDFSTAVSLAGV